MCKKEMRLQAALLYIETVTVSHFDPSQNDQQLLLHRELRLELLIQNKNVELGYYIIIYHYAISKLSPIFIDW